VDDLMNKQYDIDIRGASHSLKFLYDGICKSSRMRSMSDGTWMKQASTDAGAAAVGLGQTSGFRVGGVGAFERKRP
jgi:hypothetical protein